MTSSFICSYIGATFGIVVERGPFGQRRLDEWFQSLWRGLNTDRSFRSVFQSFKHTMNISLVHFVFENRPSPMQEVTEGVALRCLLPT